MSQANAGELGKSYWATTTENSNVSNKSEDENSSYNTVSTLQISNISKVNAKYSCTSTLNIKGTGTLATYAQTQDNPEPQVDAANKIVAEDGVIKLKKSSSNNDKLHAIKFDGTKDSKDLDLLSVLKSTDGTNVTVTYELTSSSEIESTETITAAIDAAMGIKNRKAGQNYLAGKDLTLTITNTLTSCDIVDNFAD